MAGYTTGMELYGRMQASKEAAKEADRKRKAQIEADKEDAIEGVYPEALMLAGPRAARLGARTVDAGIEALAARQGPLTSERIRKLWPEIAPGKVPPTKTYLEESLGVRSPAAKPMTAAAKARRNATGRADAKEMGVDLGEYLRGLSQAKKDLHGLGNTPAVTPNTLFKKGGKVKAKKFADGGGVNRRADYVASSFDQAFSRARRSGAKTFKWADPKTGKMNEYSTKMAGEETVKSKPSDAADKISSPITRNQPSPADKAAGRAKNYSTSGPGTYWHYKEETGIPGRGGAINTTSNSAAKENARNQEAVDAAREANRLASEEFQNTRQRASDILDESSAQKRDLALGALSAFPLGRAAGAAFKGLKALRGLKGAETAAKVTEKAAPEARNLKDYAAWNKYGVKRATEIPEAESWPTMRRMMGMKKGGAVKQKPGKVKTVMHEFKAGKLKSSSGQKVTNPKQAVAIAMSEAGMSKKRKFGDGGRISGPEELRRELEISKSAQERSRGADNIKGTGKFTMEEMKDGLSIKELKENAKKNAGMKKGGEVGHSKAMAKKEVSFMQRKGAPKSMIKHEKEEYGLKKGGRAKCYAAGGNIAMKSGGGIDGVAKKGKTNVKHYAKGGSVSSRADGIASKGKTKCKTV